MKFLTKLIVFLLIMGATLHIALFSVKFTAPNQIGVVEEIESGKVVGSYTGKISFVWQGALLPLYRTYEISTVRSQNITADATIPPLQDLKSGFYSVKIPIRVAYTLTRDGLFDRDLLGEYGERLDHQVAAVVKGAIAGELDSYLRPLYFPQAVEMRIGDIVESASKKAGEELGEIGIKAVRITRNGPAVIPTTVTYNEGIGFLAAMRAMEHDDAMKLIRLKNELDRGRLADAEYVKKLTALSKVLRQNPDIIRYIYIDKISANAKVILPNELYDILVGNLKNRPRHAEGDIDNLR